MTHTQNISQVSEAIAPIFDNFKEQYVKNYVEFNNIGKTYQWQSVNANQLMDSANRMFKMKLKNVAEKIIKKGFDFQNIDLNSANINGGELTFKITNETQIIDARVVYVYCTKKAPHYRFITTIRKK